MALHPVSRARRRPASFDMTGLLTADELPHRPAVDLQAMLGQFTDQAAQF